jgi:CBS domain-containing protein
MSVARICISDVETAGPDQSVAETARRMRERGMGTVVVVDEEYRPMGLVSDRDVALRVVGMNRDPARTMLRDVMTPMPMTVLMDTTIETAIGHMRTGRLRRLPVVDGIGKLLGIVTLDDILRFMAEEFVMIERLLESEAPGRTRG